MNGELGKDYEGVFYGDNENQSGYTTAKSRFEPGTSTVLPLSV
jgi:hypothetical protein